MITDKKIRIVTSLINPPLYNEAKIIQEDFNEKEI